jgi:hypothetical protein
MRRHILIARGLCVAWLVGLDQRNGASVLLMCPDDRRLVFHPVGEYQSRET